MEIVSLERNSNGRVGRFIKKEVYGRGILAGFKTEYGWAFGTLNKSQFKDVLFGFHSTKTVRDRIKAMTIKIDEVVLNDRGYIDWDLTIELAEAPMRFRQENGFTQESVAEEIEVIEEVVLVAKESKPLSDIVIKMHVGEVQEVKKAKAKTTKKRKTTKKDYVCKGIDYSLEALRIKAIGNLIDRKQSVDELNILLEVDRLQNGRKVA